MGNYWFFFDGYTYLSFEDVSGCYESKTGADDLWVLPKPCAGAVKGETSGSPLETGCRQRHSNPCLRSATRKMFRIMYFDDVDSTIYIRGFEF